MFNTRVRGVVVFACFTGCAVPSAESYSSEDELDASVAVVEGPSALYRFVDAALGNTWPVEFGTPVRDSLTGVATDSDGGVYVTGATAGNLGGPDAGPMGTDFFLAGFRPNGEYDWWDTLGTISSDIAYSVAANSGGVYVTGLTHSALHGEPNAGNGDAFLSKFDRQGVRQWTEQFGTNVLDIGTDVALVGSLGIVVVGNTRGSLPGNTSLGGADAFLTRYVMLGSPLVAHTRQFGTSGDDSAVGVATDSAGNAYVAGHTGLSLDGQTHFGDTDTFVMKFNANGLKQWTRQVGSSAADNARGIASDAAGNLYVVGHTSGVLGGNFNAGSTDVFLLKFDAGGLLLWTRMFGSSGSDYAGDVCLDATGNVYATGRAANGFDGQVSAGGTDAFLVKYDAAGNKQWTRLYGSAGSDFGEAVAAQGNKIIVAGDTYGALPGKVNQGDMDVFVVRFDSAGALAP